VAITLCVQVDNSAGAYEADYQKRLLLLEDIDHIRDVAPPGSVIFDSNTGVLHQLQFSTNYVLYSGESLNAGYIRKLPDMDPDAPQGLDPGRRDALYRRLSRMKQSELDAEGRASVQASIDSGKRVFFVMPRRYNTRKPPKAPEDWKPELILDGNVRRLAGKEFHLKVMEGWKQYDPRDPEVDRPRARGRRTNDAWRRWRPQQWMIVEAVPAPPPAPTTRRAK
jgi:hypothetical protein